MLVRPLPTSVFDKQSLSMPSLLIFLSIHLSFSLIYLRMVQVILQVKLPSNYYFDEVSVVEFGFETFYYSSEVLLL